MQWSQSSAIGLAKASCAHCEGLGMLSSRGGREMPCNCVLRAIFRACFNRFRDCAGKGVRASAVSLEFCRGRDGRRTYSRKREEFMADFCLIGRRVLDSDEYRLFRFHFLLGADWRLCTRRLGLDRGNFFHSVYRIEQKLGRAFAETEPYSLYPVSDYFAGVIQRDFIPSPSVAPVRRISSRLRPPLALSA